MVVGGSRGQTGFWGCGRKKRRRRLSAWRVFFFPAICCGKLDDLFKRGCCCQNKAVNQLQDHTDCWSRFASLDAFWMKLLSSKFKHIYHISFICTKQCENTVKSCYYNNIEMGGVHLLLNYILWHVPWNIFIFPFSLAILQILIMSQWQMERKSKP